MDIMAIPSGSKSVRAKIAGEGASLSVATESARRNERVEMSG